MELKTTGKFPIEHIITREKQRIAKKTSELETKIIKGANKQIKISKEKVMPVKNIVEKLITKLNNNLFKVKTFAVENFKHRPRFSYKTR